MNDSSTAQHRQEILELFKSIGMKIGFHIQRGILWFPLHLETIFDKFQTDWLMLFIIVNYYLN